MADLVYIQNNIEITDNLLPIEFNFDNDYTYSFTGTGVVENIEGLSYTGLRSLRINNLNNQNTDLVVSLYPINLTIQNAGKYNLSFYLYNGFFENGDEIQLQIFKNGALFETLILEPFLNNVSSSVTQWKRYAQVFTNSIGSNDYTFKIIAKANASSITNDKSYYIDGFKVEFNDKNLVLPAPYTEPKIINYSQTNTIDVPSISSNSSYEVTTELIGAKVGDLVGLIYPNELITLGLIVSTPLVTANDEVKFIIHNHSGSSVNPASGSYTLKTIK
jgi:hypothetical protein